MSGRKALHLHRPRHPAEDILTVALLAGMALALAVGVHHPAEAHRAGSGRVSAIRDVRLLGPCHQAERRVPRRLRAHGEPLFIQDIKFVTITYAYRFASQFPHGVIGTIGLSALFSSDSSSWHHTYVLSKARPFRGDKSDHS